MKTKILIILLVNSNLLLSCWPCCKSEISQEERERQAEKAEWERKYEEYRRTADVNGKKLINLLRLGDTKTALELLSAGKINVNVCDEYGTTPLMLACAQGYTDIIQFLFQDVKINLFSKNNYGETAFTAAIKSQNPETVKLIKVQISEYALDLIRLSINDEKLKTIIDLLETDQLYVNYQNKYGHSLLAHAARHGCKVLVEILLKNGADINIREKDNTSVWSGPIFYNYYKIVELLIDKGIELNIKSENGWTALKWAIYCYGYDRKQYEIIKLLLKKGAVLEKDEDRDINRTVHGLLNPNCIHDPVLKLLSEFKIIDINAEVFQYYKSAKDDHCIYPHES